MAGKKFDKKVIAYALGGLGDSIFHTFATSYMLTFLTTVVKMDAGKAGTIAAMGLMTDAVMSLFVGRFSDGLKCKYGRRRPIILAMSFASPLCFALLFRNFQPQSSSLQTAFYIVAAFLYYTTFSFFYVTYIALGADVAVNYEDRIRLNTISRLIGGVAGLLDSAIPIGVIGRMERAGMPAAKAWGITTFCIAVIVACAMLFSWRFTRGCERMSADEVESQPVKYMFRDFAQLCRIKPYRILMYSKTFLYVVTSFFGGTLLFYMTFVIRANSDMTSLFYTYKQAITFVVVLIVNWGAIKYGKRDFLIATAAVCGTASLILYLSGIRNFAVVMIYGTFNAMIVTCFWQLINTNYYDIADIDYFINGVKREGNVMAFQSFATTAAQSIAVKVLALLLAASGFNGELEVQTETAVNMVRNAFMLIPAVCIFGIGAMMLLYKVNKKGLDVLRECQELKDAGQEIPADKLEVVNAMLR